MSRVTVIYSTAHLGTHTLNANASHQQLQPIFDVMMVLVHDTYYTSGHAHFFSSQSR